MDEKYRLREFIRGIIKREKDKVKGTHRLLAHPHRAFYHFSCIFERVLHAQTQTDLLREMTLKLSLTHSLKNMNAAVKRSPLLLSLSHFVLIPLTPSFQPSPETHFVYTAKFISGSLSVVGSFSLAALLIIKV